MDWDRIIWWALWVLVYLMAGIGLPAAPILAERNACLSIPGNTWTFPGGCHWPPLDLGAPPTSSKGGE